MSTRDPKEIRDTILAIMRNTFGIDGPFSMELDAALRHAAGNVAQWVFLEYVDAKEGE